MLPRATENVAAAAFGPRTAPDVVNRDTSNFTAGAEKLLQTHVTDHGRNEATQTCGDSHTICCMSHVQFHVITVQVVSQLLKQSGSF